MSTLDELLESEAGRKALMEAIPRLFLHRGDAEPRLEDAPIDRIAWCADHRINSLPQSVVDNLQVPVSLNRVFINGRPLYLVFAGNHRIERFVEAGRKTIPAKVTDFDLAPAVLKKGVFTEFSLEKVGGVIGTFPPRPRRSIDITPSEAELYKSLGLVVDETAADPPSPENEGLLSRMLKRLLYGRKP